MEIEKEHNINFLNIKLIVVNNTIKNNTNHG